MRWQLTSAFSVSVPADKITLFHARFSLQDRLNKEAQVLHSFAGKVHLKTDKVA
jgi:CRISPR/Cas system-associated endonuclease/helicase Cas3